VHLTGTKPITAAVAARVYDRPMTDWQRVSDPERGIQFDVPTATAGGEPIEVVVHDDGEILLLHARSPDRSEVYVEVLS
jgi:hypothetical protein